MIKKLLVFTEGSPEIGLGHLVECYSIIDSLKNEGCLEKTFFIINNDNGAIKYLNSKNIQYISAKDRFIPSSEFIKTFNAILVNKKQVEYEFLKSLRKFNKKLIVIDELGGKKITSEVLINFSINTKRYNYVFPDKKPETLFGPEYFPVGMAVYDALSIPKSHDSKNIIVSLGGYDNSRIIEKVLTALKEYKNFRKEIILGAGFKKSAVFKTLTKSLNNTFKFYENVNNLPQRIRQAKFLISSGGNTLYEAAIVGTPTLVIGEDPHEMEQGNIFQNRGLSVNIENGKNAGPDELIQGIEKMLCFNISSSKLIKLKNWMNYINEIGT